MSNIGIGDRVICVDTTNCGHLLQLYSRYIIDEVYVCVCGLMAVGVGVKSSIYATECQCGHITHTPNEMFYINHFVKEDELDNALEAELNETNVLTNA